MAQAFTVEETLKGLHLRSSFPYLRKDAEWLVGELMHDHSGCVPVVLSGSTSFAYEEREAMLACCEHLGRLLASHSSFLLITGGMTGVGEYTSEQYVRGEGAEENRLYHVLPVEVHDHFGIPVPPHGVTHYLGGTFFERQVILGLSTRLVVVIGGGPGSAREANTALAEGAVVVPLGVSGGAAGGVRFDRGDERDAGIDLALVERRVVDETGLLTKSQWQRLSSPTSSPDEAMGVVGELLCGIESWK